MYVLHAVSAARSLVAVRDGGERRGRYVIGSLQMSTNVRIRRRRRGDGSGQLVTNPYYASIDALLLHHKRLLKKTNFEHRARCKRRDSNNL